ncbi:MAG: hypothetical protein HY744_27870 [Deltaproteobacteria bacterium]|nr:hypothetical protein [Deltaproteobacteria bacterium]
MLLGASLMVLCRAFPASILGAMLAFGGLELALVARQARSRTDAFAMLLTAGACLGLNDVALGFAIGLGAALCLRQRAFSIEPQQAGEITGTDAAAR